MNDCNNCTFKKELDELKVEFRAKMSHQDEQIVAIKLDNATSKEQMKTLFNTLNKIDKGMEKIQESIERIDKNFDPEAIKKMQQDAISPEEFKKLKEEVQNLKDKPGKKWDQLWTAVVTAVCTTGAVIFVYSYILKVK